MFTLAVLSQKGGSGKSTFAVHSAAQAVHTGYTSLVLDLDPQGSAMTWKQLRGAGAPDVKPQHPSRLKEGLLAAARGGYDLVVLDTPPHSNMMALEAARAADLILVPCRPAKFDLSSVQDTLEICKQVGRTGIVVLNMAPVRSRAIEEAKQELRRLGATVSEHVIRHRVAYHHCLNDGRVACEYEPDGLAASEFSTLFQHHCLPALGRGAAPQPQRCA